MTKNSVFRNIIPEFIDTVTVSPPPSQRAAPIMARISKPKAPPPPAEPASDSPLERYMAMLEIVAAFRGALTLADAAIALDLPKTTAHRLLKGLVRAGLATQGAGGRTYQLGDRLTRLLHAAADDGWLAALARPHLQRLTDACGETCYLTRLIGTRVVVVASLSPDARWRGYVQPGIEMPPNAAATGKAIIAYQSAELIDAALAHELPRLTVNTRNDAVWVRRVLNKVRQRGYATCVGEIDEGLAALAVPVVQPDGEVFYSLGMTGPLPRIMNGGKQKRIKALRASAERLAAVLTLGGTIAPAPDKVG